MRRLLRAVWLTAALALGGPGAALADEADVLIVSIQSDLRGLARDLGALGRASADEGDVKKVSKNLVDLVDPLIELVFEGGDNTQAERILKGYPESLVDLLEALEHMEAMKGLAGTIGMDDEQRLCEVVYPRDMPKEFRDALAKRGTTRSTLDAIARKYAELAESHIDQARDIVADLDQLRDEISSYSPKHRDFNALRSALVGAADDVYEAEEGIMEVIEVDCGPLVDWKDFQAYQDAVEQLEDVGAAIAKFQTDAKAWMEANTAVGEKVCTSLRLLRDAICNQDWEDVNFGGMSGFEKVADDTANDFRNDLLDLKREYENNLRSRGQSLGPLDSRAQRAFDIIKARHKKLGRYIYGPSLKGSNNPKVRLWMLYGLQQHRDMTKSFGCHLADRNIPGGGDDRNFPDCILFKTNNCQVIEFKPGTPSGRAAGVKITTYVSMVNKWLEAQWPKFETTPVPRPAARRGMDFDDEFVLQARAYGCIDEYGRARFSGYVKTYEPCTKDNDLQCKMPD